ncbi:MAG: hypothetical protein OJF47_001749 [Nitrospira sp.]|nr:MAG: hypothetical protein OJF47_001749 [Nitrospira sp.]
MRTTVNERRAWSDRYRPIIRRIDIDAAGGFWLVEIGILEDIERLDVFVRRQSLAIPTPAECAKKGDRIAQEVRPDLYGVTA